MSLTEERRRELTARTQLYAANVSQAMPYLWDRGISDQVAEMFQLGFVPEGHEYEGRLAIPYLSPAGVVQIKYRCTETKHGDHKGVDCPKYLYEAGSSVYLYNAHVLVAAVDTVVLTEGELDAICVQAYTGLPAVAYPGVKTWRKPENNHWPLCFEGVNEVIVVADGDSDGRSSAEHVSQTIGSNARVVLMPNGDDANTYIASQGAGAFLERIK